VCGRADVEPFQITPESARQPVHIEYESPTALAFDSHNVPYMFNTQSEDTYGRLWTMRGGQWVHSSYLEAIRRIAPDAGPPRTRYPHAHGSITIDDHDRLFAVIPASRDSGVIQYFVIYSDDGARTMDVRALPLTVRQAFLEIRTGHGDLNEPPAIGLLTLKRTLPEIKWGDEYELSVVLPRIQGGKMQLGEPIPVTSRCLGVANHSGGYSFAVTRGDRVAVTYVGTPQSETSGNPTWVAMIDRTLCRLRHSKLITYALPDGADVHSTPVIAADSTGRFHVIAGAHNQSFASLHTVRSGDVQAEWSGPRELADGQTYASLVCDSEDRLFVVYRRLTDGVPVLMVQQKDAGQTNWSRPRPLVLPPAGHHGYGIFYHRLFIDRQGGLYVSYTFFAFNDSRPYRRRLIVSEDGGRTWHPARTQTFIKRMKFQESTQP
jgi:hypothetical protein